MKLSLSKTVCAMICQAGETRASGRNHLQQQKKRKTSSSGGLNPGIFNNLFKVQTKTFRKTPFAVCRWHHCSLRHSITCHTDIVLKYYTK